MRSLYYHFFISPFNNWLWFFLDIWLLTSAADCWYWSIHGNPVFGCYMACHGLILTYAIVFICQFFRGVFAKILKVFLLVLGVINLIADSLVHNIMHFSFTQDMVAIILGSNLSEANEFLPMYFTPNVICFICVVLVMAFCIWYFRLKYQTCFKTWMGTAALSICILIAGVIAIRKSNNWEGVFLCKIKTFMTYEKPVDLRIYRTLPIVTASENQPDNVVMIIGESLSRNHCSLYGYEKPTQPCLGQMLKDSEIFILNNVEAAYSNTTEAFKSLMSTYKASAPSEKWYTHNVFLLDIMKAYGYQTFWISNQSSIGLYDNVVARFAQLADSTIWVGSKGMGIGKHDFDELVIPVVKSVASMPGNKFYVIHLMGSHEGFEARYPDSFKRFTPDLYEDKPENQRWILASYDNSVYYNDFVVSELIKIFVGNGRNLVMYFPDHGLDIYDTDSDYAGHARPTDSLSFKAGISIPFIITKSGLINESINTEDLPEHLAEAVSSYQ